MKTKAVILAGGKGTRMGDLVKEIPKPMLKVGGVPILEHQLRLLKRYGMEQVTLITGYLSAVIEDYFRDGSGLGLKIDYLKEKKPLGTAGGIRKLKDKIASDCIVLYGDVMINMDLKKLLEFHRSRGSDCTLALHPNDHPYDSDLVEINTDGRIIRFHPKPHPEGKYFRNLVSAGVYVLSPAMIKYIEEDVEADFGRDIFPGIVSSARLYGYNTAEYIKDVGTPERLEEVCRDHLCGKIEMLNSENKRPAIFLDRDGVINEKVGLLHRIEDFKLLDGVAKAVRKINQSQFLSIVLTNQPVIARNLCSIEQLEEIHKKMDALLGKERAKLDALYYCPHHPDKGYPGENARFKVECECRKPKTGMIEKAQREFNIDLAKSFLIGDSFRDILCGKNAGLTTVGLMTGDACKDGNIEPDYLFADLQEAVDFIIENSQQAASFLRLEETAEKSAKRD